MNEKRTVHCTTIYYVNSTFDTSLILIISQFYFYTNSNLCFHQLQRTPDAIAAAYKVRQGQIAAEEANKKEGLEGWIEKAKEFYFFGFFEGETGEKAPWILRPSITFPIAFAIVGAGFYVTFALGGISERGKQVTDELDDIVLTYNVVKSALVVAFAQMQM